MHGDIPIVLYTYHRALYYSVPSTWCRLYDAILFLLHCLQTVLLRKPSNFSRTLYSYRSKVFPPVFERGFLGASKGTASLAISQRDWKCPRIDAIRSGSPFPCFPGAVRIRSSTFSGFHGFRSLAYRFHMGAVHDPPKKC
jgi:hypothetical protein